MSGCILSPYKVAYDSRQEAISGAVQAWRRFGDPMMPYLCGDHWHVTHSNNPNAQRARAALAATDEALQEVP